MKRDLGSDISSLEFRALARARGRGRGHFARDVICRRVAQLLSLLTHRETMLAMRRLSLLNKGALIDDVCKQVGGQGSRNHPVLEFWDREGWVKIPRKHEFMWTSHVVAPFKVACEM